MALRNFLSLRSSEAYFRLFYCILQSKIEQLIVFSEGNNHERSIRVSDCSIRVSQSLP